jgi:hypothetical protein
MLGYTENEDCQGGGYAEMLQKVYDDEGGREKE